MLNCCDNCSLGNCANAYIVPFLLVFVGLDVGGCPEISLLIYYLLNHVKCKGFSGVERPVRVICRIVFQFLRMVEFAGTLCVSQTLPPIVLLSPIWVSPPRIVAPE